MAPPRLCAQNATTNGRHVTNAGTWHRVVHSHTATPIMQSERMAGKTTCAWQQGLCKNDVSYLHNFDCPCSEQPHTALLTASGLSRPLHMASPATARCNVVICVDEHAIGLTETESTLWDQAFEEAVDEVDPHTLELGVMAATHGTYLLFESARRRRGRGIYLGAIRNNGLSAGILPFPGQRTRPTGADRGTLPTADAWACIRGRGAACGACRYQQPSICYNEWPADADSSDEEDEARLCTGLREDSETLYSALVYFNQAHHARDLQLAFRSAAELRHHTRVLNRWAHVLLALSFKVLNPYALRKGANPYDCLQQRWVPRVSELRPKFKRCIQLKCAENIRQLMIKVEALLWAHDVFDVQTHSRLTGRGCAMGEDCFCCAHPKPLIVTA